MGGLDSLEDLWHPSNKITIKRVEPPVGTDGEQIVVQAHSGLMEVGRDEGGWLEPVR